MTSNRSFRLHLRVASNHYAIVLFLGWYLPCSCC